MNVLATSEQMTAQILSDFLPLIQRLAKILHRRLPRHVAVGDLEVAGMMGLVAAINGFEPGRGPAFTSYARIRIRGAMLDELHAQDWLPRHARALRKLMEVSEDRFRAAYDRRPTGEELAELLKVPSAVLEAAQALDAARLSPAQTAEPRPALERSPFESLTSREDAEALAVAMTALTDIERGVIDLFYNGESRLKDIGRLIGVSEGRVSQIHRRALIKLRGALRSSS